MIELPRALLPWRDVLALLPDEIALGLAPTLGRLALAIGPLRVRAELGHGEPDGFHGISRRGRFDRLLLSEWLLATEEPLELVRRAAMGELAFLELARREPARSLSSIAVFDAGPDQLGAPRVVQLAILLVMARRATEAGADFRWGVLQSPEAPLTACALSADVGAFVKARTREPARAVHVEAWRLRSSELGSEDFWLVGDGAAALAARACGCGSFAIDDSSDPGSRAMRVEVSPRSRPQREVTLELPSEALAVRMLRDPLGVARTVPRKVNSPDRRPASNLMFAANGRKLFARGRGGELIAYPIPNSPRAGVGRPKVYRPTPSASGATPALLAAASYRHSVFIATVADGRPRIERMGRAPEPAIDVAHVWPRQFDVPEPRSLQPLVFTSYGPHAVPMLVDGGGNLFELGSFFDPPIARLAVDVRGLAAPAHDAWVYVGRRVLKPGSEPESGWSLVAGRVHRSVQPPTAVELPGDGPFTTFFSGHLYAHSEHHHVAAVEQERDVWTIHSAQTLTVLHPGVGARVVGVVCDGPKDRGPCLVVWDEERSVSVVGRSFSRMLPLSPEPIAAVAVSSAHADIAYTTTSGRLVVFSLAHNAAMLEMTFPGEGT